MWGNCAACQKGSTCSKGKQDDINCIECKREIRGQMCFDNHKIHNICAQINRYENCFAIHRSVRNILVKKYFVTRVTVMCIKTIYSILDYNPFYKPPNEGINWTLWHRTVKNYLATIGTIKHLIQNTITVFIEIKSAIAWIRNCNITLNHFTLCNFELT